MTRKIAAVASQDARLDYERLTATPDDIEFERIGSEVGVEHGANDGGV